MSDQFDVLAGYKTVVSDDPAKYDPELRCAACGAVVCDVQHGDGLDVLVRTAADHTMQCAGGTGAAQTGELSLSAGDQFAAVELLSAWGGDDLPVKLKAVGPEGWGGNSKWVNVPGWLLRKIVHLVNDELSKES